MPEAAGQPQTLTAVFFFPTGFPEDPGKMNDRPHTPVLDRGLTLPPRICVRPGDADLKQCADELRAETISAVSETGGHLGSSLGVVELNRRDPRGVQHAA